MTDLETSTTLATAPPRPARLIPLLGLLAAFPPLATDMYLSGLPQMGRDFGAAEGGMEITLSVFFLGLALGQAIYGPVIDRFGRRVPLLAGIALYSLATLGCLLTRDLELFTVLRLLQAMGGCAGMIVGRAIISDVFDAREASRALTLTIAIMTLGPICAPLLGGVLIAHWGWEAVFAFMLVVGVASFGLVLAQLPETLAPRARRPIDAHSVLRGWAGLLGRRGFIVPALVGGLTQAAMFAFITGSAAVLMQQFGLSEIGYGLAFGAVALGLVVAAQLNRAQLRRHSPAAVMPAVLGLGLAAGIALVLVAPLGNLWLLLVPLWLAIAAVGAGGPNGMAMAMEAARGRSGAGSALVGVLQFALAFGVSSLVSAAQNGTPWPLVLGVALPQALAALLWAAARPRG